MENAVRPYPLMLRWNVSPEFVTFQRKIEARRREIVLTRTRTILRSILIIINEEAPEETERILALKNELALTLKYLGSDFDGDRLGQAEEEIEKIFSDSRNLKDHILSKDEINEIILAANRRREEDLKALDDLIDKSTFTPQEKHALLESMLERNRQRVHRVHVAA